MFENTNWSPVESASSRPSLRDALVQRRLRHRLQHARHRDGDARVLDEAQLFGEDRRVVGVEADDHAGLHLDPVGVDPAHAFDEVAARVLGLAGLLQRLDARALDADEDGGEVGVAEQREQLVVLRGVQRDLGVEVDRVALFAAPARDLAQQILGEFLVADEIVVDDEDLLGAEPVALLDLGHHLVHLLGARAPAVDDDDVAELALERTAARELDRHGVIAVDVQQVEARHRRQREVGLLGGAVLALPGARREVAQEDRPGLLGFVHEEHVAAAAPLLGTQRRVRAAHHHEAPAALELRDDLAHPRLVDDVAGDADDVGFDVEIDRFDVLVAEHHFVLARRQPGQRRHRKVREDALLAERGQDAVVGPETGRVAGRDEIDLHGPLHERSVAL